MILLIIKKALDENENIDYTLSRLDKVFLLLSL